MDSDRLSELPDSLILEILSLLPMNDVLSTMLVSKHWLHLWTTIPCLDFKYRSKYKDKYKEFVSGALTNWKGSKIKKFSFTFNHDLDINAAMVDSWLLLAIEKQVEELHLCDDSQTKEYCLPQRLYSCLSVTKMSLSFCKLRIDDAVHWDRLKILEIEGAEWLSEDAMDRILAGAPLLEELNLAYYSSIQNLNIRSTSLKILKFSIYYYDDTLSARVVRVWAPNLLDLKIYGFFYGTCFLDVPSLTNAEICFRKSSYPVEMFHQLFRSIRNVEKLKLSKFNIKILFRLKHIFEFPRAKFLSFDVGRAEEMLGVLHMFPNLTTLRVQHDWATVFLSKVVASLSKADLASPVVRSLKRVEITWFMRDISIIPALEILLENAKLLDSMVFRANWNHSRGDMPKHKLLRKSASSPTAEVTIIHII